MSLHPDCRSFRALLAEHLGGAAGTRPLTELSWHEHLLGCGDCRALLEQEEALELVLASLPEPRLPDELARRVLERLSALQVGDPLDALLELDASPAPADLAGRVLAGLSAERRERTLDELLAEDRVEVPADLVPNVLAGMRAAREDALVDGLLERDTVHVPAGLAGRVLAGLEDARRPARPLLRLLRSPLWVTSLAAGLGALALAWWAWRLDARPEEGAPDAGGAVAVHEDDPRGAAVAEDGTAAVPGEGAAVPDEDLLAKLDVLENWELLQEFGDEVELLTTLGTEHEALLDFAGVLDEELGETGDAEQEQGDPDREG